MAPIPTLKPGGRQSARCDSENLVGERARIVNRIKGQTTRPNWSTPKPWP